MVPTRSFIAVTIHNLLRKLLSLDEIFFARNVSKRIIKINKRYGGRTIYAVIAKKKCSTTKCSCKSNGLLYISKCHNNLNCCNK